MQSIGFIGVGVMGKPMVRNLCKAGYELHIYTRTKAKVEDLLLEEGVHWCKDIGDCISDRDAVITMLGFPSEVESLYFEEEGLLRRAASGVYLIDMSTTNPSLSQRIYTAGKARGLKVLDAPVSGGDSGAINGTLSIMVGGEQTDYVACLPLFEAMGKNITYQGAAGAGQHCKMANQIALAGCIAGVCEAMKYAETTGLDVAVVLDSISQGAAGSWQMSNTAPRILAGDMQPGFYIKHYVKDLRIACNQAMERGVNLEVAKQVYNAYETLEEEGMGDLGTQALIKYYD